MQQSLKLSLKQEKKKKKKSKGHINSYGKLETVLIGKQIDLISTMCFRREIFNFCFFPNVLAFPINLSESFELR